MAHHDASGDGDGGDQDGAVSDEAPTLLTPTLGVDPRVALATSMHAAPGVYAVLVGSGMSSAAGILTGCGLHLT